MTNKKIYSQYQKKIKDLKKYNKFYFEKSKPLISDKDYDKLKKEVIEIENKYKDLVQKSNELKTHLKKMEQEQNKNKQLQEQFNQDIEELGQETDSLVDEIEKWQI